MRRPGSNTVGTTKSKSQRAVALLRRGGTRAHERRVEADLRAGDDVDRAEAAAVEGPRLRRELRVGAEEADEVPLRSQARVLVHRADDGAVLAPLQRRVHPEVALGDERRVDEVVALDALAVDLFVQLGRLGVVLGHPACAAGLEVGEVGAAGVGSEVVEEGRSVRAVEVEARIVRDARDGARKLLWQHRARAVTQSGRLFFLLRIVGLGAFGEVQHEFALGAGAHVDVAADAVRVVDVVLDEFHDEPAAAVVDALAHAVPRRREHVARVADGVAAALGDELLDDPLAHGALAPRCGGRRERGGHDEQDRPGEDDGAHGKLGMENKKFSAEGGCNQ
mmetsp:Transcript_38723/g.119694  ORF Transcript_38723/g.119694 Transcript_38723/m.119694 type:complete len:336 (+) Transcript_38723:407-1414(+)